MIMQLIQIYTHTDQMKIKTTLEKISTAVAEMKKKPTNALVAT